MDALESSPGLHGLTRSFGASDEAAFLSLLRLTSCARLKNTMVHSYGDETYTRTYSCHRR